MVIILCFFLSKTSANVNNNSTAVITEISQNIYRKF